MPTVRSLMMELEQNLAEVYAADDSSAEALPTRTDIASNDAMSDALEVEASEEVPPDSVPPEIFCSDRLCDPAYDESLLIEPPELSEFEQDRWEAWRLAARLNPGYIPSPAQIDTMALYLREHGLESVPMNHRKRNSA